MVNLFGCEGVGKSAFLLNLAYFIWDRKYEKFKCGVILLQNLNLEELKH